MRELDFEVAGAGPLRLSPRRAIVAGWTGRDRAAVDHHIAELSALGVTPPSAVPLFYRVSAELLTQAEEIQLLGAEASGEVEPVLVDDGDALHLGLGSDITDRALEAQSVAVSKQACAKPLARGLWRFEEVTDHLDEIRLRSWIRDEAEADWTLYQDGTLAKIRPLADLVAASPAAEGAARLTPGTVMMCGTLGAIGPVRAARHFAMELHDPVVGRTIAHNYAAVFLPVVA